MNIDLSRARGPGRAAMALFAFNAVIPVLSRLIFAVVHVRGLGEAITALEGLTTFAGVICFMVWLYRATSAVKQATGASRFTPGMAVGGWFIPFANFVLPALSMGDVWRRARGTQGWLVGLWWGTYLGTIVFRMVWSAPPLAYRAASVPGMGWLSTAVSVTAYGAWAYMLYALNEVERAPEGAALSPSLR